MTSNKQVKKWSELQTTGDPDYKLLVVRVTWLIIWWESAIIAQGYISFGEFATKLIANGSYRVSKDTPCFVELVSSGNF